MGAGFATVTEDDGVLVTSASVNGFTLADLRFPPRYVQPAFEPDRPYLALVLDGAVEKSFARRTVRLERASGVSMPAGAVHGARFGPAGARIVVVKLERPSSPGGRCLGRLAELRGRGFAWLGWRLAGELRASDAAAPLAAEGIALGLLAACDREQLGAERRPKRPTPWLRAAEELLHAQPGDRRSLGELAEAVGVHPAHLARAFRARHGVSVGEYGRRVRLEWAAAEVARGETPLAAIAAQAGFADQSHFTRVFRRHVGTTPARYRDETRGART